MSEIDEKMKIAYENAISRLKSGEILDEKTMKFVQSYSDSQKPLKKRGKSVQKAKRVRKQKVG